jgi:hypothetical protein
MLSLDCDRTFSHTQQKKRHIEERGLLNVSQFGFRAHPSMTCQCMRLTDHVTLNFNSKMSMAPVFWDIGTAFDTTWHFGLLYKLFKLKFSVSLIQLISFSLSQRKSRVLVRGEMSTPRDIKHWCHKVPSCLPHCTLSLSLSLSLSLYIYIHTYIHDTPKHRASYLGLFAVDICTRSDSKVRKLATVFLPWQQWTKTSVWFDDGISVFHSCVVELWQSLSGVYYCPSVFWCAVTNNSWILHHDNAPAHTALWGSF